MLDLVALSLSASANCESFSLQLVKNSCAYYHYLCDKMDDRGWGCGYRSLQSLCSWADGDKPPSFASSNNWIGCFEACIVLDHVYKLIHVPSGSEVQSHVPALFEHFKISGAPVMIGGDLDAASKTLVGIRLGKHEEVEFLIADPHYIGESSEDEVFSKGYVKWHNLNLFQPSSFYNFCLPILPSI
ncbi:hypothetical protein EMCRGX_G032656 [Ephydatia muelleri]